MKIDLLSDAIPLLIPGQEGSYAFRQGQAELFNAAGEKAVTLDAFQVSTFAPGAATTLFTLYKTKEGNWYENDEPRDSTEAALRRAVKLAIDRLATTHV